MSSDTLEESEPKDGEISNFRDPINLKDMKLAGAIVEAAQGGDEVQICTRITLISDQEIFQKRTFRFRPTLSLRRIIFTHILPVRFVNRLGNSYRCERNQDFEDRHKVFSV